MKVCLITCHYPPMARALRRYEYARCLADGGCDVEVVTHGNISHALGAYEDDPELSAEDPDIRVHRPKAMPWHLAGDLIYRAGLLPCPYANWYRPAVRAARDIVDSASDAVVGIYPPLTNLLAAHAVAERTGAKLVLDYRDEYLGLATGFRKPLARRIHKRLLKRADLVSVATRAIEHGLVSRDGFPPSRIALTSNGYWHEVEGATGYAPANKMRIVYAGAISQIQGLGVLCDALGILWKTRPETATDIECAIYGPDNFYLRRVLQPRLGKGVEYGGFVPAKEVTNMLLSADVCFLSLASDDFSYAIPSKLYEYIAHLRPILGALPQGAARELIDGEEFGLTSDCGREDDLAQQIVAMMSVDRRIEFHQNLIRGKAKYAGRPHFLALAKRIQQL